VRIPILLCVLTCCFFGCAITGEDNNDYTLYLVRHAEKQTDQGRDPDLTTAGEHRSQRLATWFQDKDVQDIWSSDYKRTQGTAKPLVDSSGLDLRIYDPRDLVSLSSQLAQIKHNAVIVGHSNTTPDLARALCGCEIDDMDESEYDRLIVISVIDDKTRVQTLRQTRLFNLQ
jgi:phosphohistidine phosphatase SixA